MTRVPWLGNLTYSENRDGAEREIREKVERRCAQQRNRESIWTIASGIFGFVEKYVQNTFSQKCAYIYIYLTNCTYLNYSEGEETYARTSSSVEKNICQMENDDKTGITHRELKKIKETRVKRRRNVE